MPCRPGPRGPRRKAPYEVVCFSARPAAGAEKPKRSKFTDDRRREVATVRFVRACLRCRLLKIPCSGDEPCQTCLALALGGHENKVLHFSYCIRSQFKQVNLFQRLEGPVPDTLAWSALLASADPSLAFDVAWDMDALVGMATAWIRDPSSVDCSLTGTFSSRNFSALLGRHLDPAVADNLRVLVYAVSLAHIRSSSAPGQDDATNLSPSNLQAVGYVAGCAILDCLDQLLAPKNLLRKAGDGDHVGLLQSIFLLVCGTFIALGYARRLDNHPLFPESQDAEPTATPTRTLWEAMQEHASQMLAHYLIFLSERLDCALPPGVERTLVAAGSNAWRRFGQFTWQATRSPDPPLVAADELPASGPSCFISGAGVRGPGPYHTQQLQSPPTLPRGRRKGPTFDPDLPSHAFRCYYKTDDDFPRCHKRQCVASVTRIGRRPDGQDMFSGYCINHTCSAEKPPASPDWPHIKPWDCGRPQTESCELPPPVPGLDKGLEPWPDFMWLDDFAPGGLDFKTEKDYRSRGDDFNDIQLFEWRPKGEKGIEIPYLSSFEPEIGPGFELRPEQHEWLVV